MALLAGLQLDLFSALKGKDLSAEDLADSCELDVRGVGILLHALVAADLLELAEDGRLRNTEEASWRLVRSSAEFMGDKHRLWADL